MKDVFMDVFRSAPAAMLLSVFVQCTAVLTVAMLVARLLRRNPAARYAVLWTGMLCALACPFASGLLKSANVRCFSILVSIAGEAERTNEATTPSAINEPPPTEPSHAVFTAIQALQPPDATSSPSVATDDSQIPAPVFSQRSESVPTRRTEPRTVASPWLLAAILIWAAGCAWRVVGLARSWFKLRRVVRRACPIADARVRCIAQACRGELGSRRRVALLTSSDVNCPVAAGWRRPVILLPRGFCDELTDDELRAVLLHELAHVARNDHAALLLEGVFAAIYWPHPLAACLRRCLARSREEICDNYVVRRTDRRAYSELLLRLAKSRPPRPLVAVGVGLFSTRWRLETRVAALLDERRRTMVRTSRLTTLMIAAAMLAMVLGIGATKVVAEREAPQDDAPAAEGSLAADRTDASNENDAAAAYVNDEPILREELAAELLERFGKSAIESLVNRKLLEQECEKRRIKITDADIAAEVERIAATFDLDREAWYSALEHDRGITRERYHRDVVWPTLAIVRIAETDNPNEARDFFFKLKSRADVAVVAKAASDRSDDGAAKRQFGNNSARAIQELRGGQRIALVNIPKIIDELPQFQEGIEALKSDVKEHEAQVLELRKEIESLERAANANIQSAKPLIDEIVIEKKADLSVLADKMQRSFRDREAEVYQAAYALIQDEISDYAVEHDIDIVLRDTSKRSAAQPISNAGHGPSKHSKVISMINQDVVYIRDARIDITDAIIDRLRERAEEKKTRR